MIRSLFRSIATSFAVILISITGLVAPTNAAIADATCLGTETRTFNPGLTNTPQTTTITLHEEYILCISSSVPAPLNGSSSGSTTRTSSCMDLFRAGHRSETIKWNTGQTSVFDFNSTFTQIEGQAIGTSTGKIISGLFAGDSAIRTEIGPALNLLNCLGPPGITSKTATLTLEITSI